MSSPRHPRFSYCRVYPRFIQGLVSGYRFRAQGVCLKASSIFLAQTSKAHMDYVWRIGVI